MNHLTDKKVMLFALGRWHNELRTGDTELDVSQARSQGKPVREWVDIPEIECDFIMRLENMRHELVS